MATDENNNKDGAKNEQKTVRKIVRRKISSFAGGSQSSGYGYGTGSYGSSYGSGSYGGSYGTYGSYSSYGGGYGYGYGGYGYGSSNGYGTAAPQISGPAEAPNRTFSDYMQILREKLWYVIVTFIIICAGMTLYTLRVERIFTATASIQIKREVDKALEGSRMYERIMNVEDLNTQIQILQSLEVVNQVKKQLSPEERQLLIAPYKDKVTFGAEITEEYVLLQNRSIFPSRLSLLVNIQFEHPNRELAIRIADLYAKEFIAFTQLRNSADKIAMIESLRDNISIQRSKVKELDNKLVTFRKDNKAGSLDQRVDIVANQLATISASVTTARQQFEAIETEWRMIQDFERERKPLWELPSISKNQRVAQLLPQLSLIDIELASLEKRYKPMHPTMKTTNRRREQLVSEINIAVNSAVNEVKATYETAQRNYENLQKSLAEKELERNELDAKAVEYKAIELEKLSAERILDELNMEQNKRLIEVTLIPPSASQIDQASSPNYPTSPNYLINTILGLLGGIFGGVVMAFIVTFLDDRAKSAHDIEVIIGIPLLGSVPRIKRLSSSEKAQITASAADRTATEAFRSILSAIKLNPVGKIAKIILSTSTTPSEGKSFVISNLAFASAINGEKVLIIDADLRIPAVAKILDIHTKTGVMSYIEKKSTLDESIVKEYFPNLDILPCETRATNSTQVLNSEEFVSMLNELRTRYDKIFIDTPPIGVVSDAISILPYVDAIIYVIKFNAVKRKFIKNQIRRLLESNVPILGAIMNMTQLSGAAGYSSSYYSKSYQNYEEPPQIDTSDGISDDDEDEDSEEDGETPPSEPSESEADDSDKKA